MSLTVELGSGDPAADAYVSVADADTHFSNRGYSLWATMSSTEKENAIRRATDFMTGAYRTRWAGERKTLAQALDWPRYNVPVIDYVIGGWGPAYYSDTAVPAEVAKACIELAYIAARGELVDDIGQVKKSVTVGPITTVYQDYSTPVKRYPKVDRILAPLLKGGGTGGGISVVRC